MAMLASKKSELKRRNRPALRLSMSPEREPGRTVKEPQLAGEEEEVTATISVLTTGAVFVGGGFIWAAVVVTSISVIIGPTD